MKTISAKVTDSEFEKIANLAAKKNLTISKLIKKSIFEAKIEDDILVKGLIRELNRIGNNINQIARYVNIKKNIDLEVLKVLSVIEDELNLIKEGFLK